MPQSSVAPISTHITVVDGQPTTTTQDIADVYGKRHDNVLNIVRQRMIEAGDWGVLNFSDTPYTNPQNGQTYPIIRMTEKGFMFVVGKFTGAKAVQHQIAFVDEFDRMKTELAKETQRTQLPAVQQPDFEMVQRINQRAWQLAQVTYEDYRNAMLNDVLVKTGHTRPEEWEPIGSIADSVDLINAVANGLEAWTKTLRKNSKRLEQLTGQRK